MSPEFLVIIYCALILMVSIAGGLVPLLVRLTHRRMQLAISLVAGVMLGVGLLHMLPHALLEAPDNITLVFVCVLGGFLTMFFIERFFCFHHHDVPMPAPEAAAGAPDHGHHDHPAQPQQHEHAPQNVPGTIRPEAHRLGWTGVAIGLTLHTVIAGIALAASIEAGSQGQHGIALAGFGTFLAIFLHKPFDAMTITTLMTLGGHKKSNAHLVNGLFALVIPVGVGLFYLGLSHAGEGSNLVAYALAFSAGTFLCVSMSDLLPELQFHNHDRYGLSVALILGLSVAGGVSLLESDNHAHAGHEHALAAENHADEHGQADHRQDSHASTAHAHAAASAHDSHDEEHDGHADTELEHDRVHKGHAQAEEPDAQDHGQDSHASAAHAHAAASAHDSHDEEHDGHADTELEHESMHKGHVQAEEPHEHEQVPAAGTEGHSNNPAQPVAQDATLSST